MSNNIAPTYLYIYYYYYYYFFIIIIVFFSTFSTFNKNSNIKY